MAEDSTRNSTGSGQMLIALEPRRERPSLARSGTLAQFVSQLLVARVRAAASLPAMKPAPASPARSAVSAYRAGSDIAVRRIPQGYRTSRMV